MSGDQNGLMASLMSELPGSVGSATASESLRSRVAAATPVITIDRTVRLRAEQGGEYTCFEVTVSILEHSWVLQKRYSEFEELYRLLFASHSKVVPAEHWPSFPQKTWLSRFDQAIVETRRQGLQVFLQACVARTLYPVILDERLRAFLRLEDGIQRAVELEVAKAAEAAAEAQRLATAKEHAQLELQRKRRAHDEAVVRDRARQQTGVDNVTSGPHVSCGVVVASPLVVAHRRYVAAGIALARSDGDQAALAATSCKRFDALCDVWGLQSLAPSVPAHPTHPAVEILASGPAAPSLIPASDDSVIHSATESKCAPAPTGGGCGGLALGLMVCCTAAGLAVVVVGGTRRGSLSAYVQSLPPSLRRFS